jgi:hypothetical protein
MNRLFILFLSFSIEAAVPHSLTAQVAAQFDTARMQRDLDIMEGILDRLVFNTPRHFIHLGGEGSRGIYLPEYGVIFLMPLRSSSFSVLALDPDESRQRSEAYKKATGAYEKAQQAKAGRRRSSSHTYQVSTRQKIEESLMEFFTKYADAIGQLENSEKIAVYAAGGENVFVSFGKGQGFSALRAEGSGERAVFTVAKKADVVALRAGRLAEDDFKNRVVFQEIAQQETSEDIDIMARIIDAALQQHAQEPIFHATRTRGIQLDDFGVLFFTNATLGKAFMFPIFKEGESMESLERQIIELQAGARRKREDWKTEYKKFKQRLGELIADYGHTLRQLEPQDHIAISADLENSPEEGPHHLVCRIKKQHVDAFNARRISREQLMKLISYAEY